MILANELLPSMLSLKGGGFLRTSWKLKFYIYYIIMEVDSEWKNI